jgi:hypothetical protein
MAGDIKVDVGSIVSGVGSIINNFRGKIPVELQGEMAKMELQIQEKMAEYEAAIASSQSAVNTVEAASSSWVARNWRPVFAWTCVLSFIIEYPLRVIVLCIFPTLNYPSIDMGVMMPPLLGLLGLGGMRTYEKRTGIIK